MIDSLHIKNFLAFKELNVSNLGQVNLITGKNNTGKTCLLDAIRCYQSRFDSSVVNNIIGSRTTFSLTNRDIYNNLFNHTFINSIFNPQKKIKIGVNQFGIERSLPSMYETFDFKIKNGEVDIGQLDTRIGMEDPLDNCSYLPFSGTFEKSIETWQKIALTPYEDEVYRIMNNSLNLEIVRIDMSGKNIRVRLKSLDKPVSLNSLGDGVKRMLQLAIFIVASENRILLIDEIEAGLHFSVLQNLWEIVFDNSLEYNIQVFITTHSNDAIKTFSHSAESPQNQNQARFIRLQHKRDQSDIEAVTYEYEMFSELVESEFELR